MADSEKALSRTQWGFWLRVKTWTYEEATLILIGVIPDISFEDFYSDGENEYCTVIDMNGAREYLELIKRSFSESELTPQKILHMVQGNEN